jgi:GEVED domain/Secretion system C-terminal sorting domain
MRKQSFLLTVVFFAAFLQFANAQVNFTARDQVTPYTGRFRAGVNLGYYPGWDNKTLADVAAGNPAVTQKGVGAKTLRPSLYEQPLDYYGFDLAVTDFQHYDLLGMSEYTALVGGPSPNHQDYSQYCPGQFSNLFANMYTPIWDGGANGTPYNDNNYFAAYIYKVGTKYKNNVRFWEIWNEPGLDLNPNGIGWRAPGYPGNWWDNDPNPCDYILRSPVEHYVRTMRIAWEVLKTVDPDSYVCLGSVGYQAMLDAVCRNTDNPNGGSATPEYPYGGGAYFDCMIYHAYPHFDGSTTNQQIGFAQRHSDQAADGVTIFRDSYQAVLNNYGFNGTQFPKKEWIITENNAPRKAYTGNYFAGELQQRNYIQKAFIVSKINKVHQMHVYQLFDQKNDNEATYEFHQMGMYKKIDGLLPYTQTVNPEGIALKTMTDLIYPTDYDLAQTAAMNLPAGVRGYAFKRSDGTFIYAVWAKTTVDLSESASATYSFPAGLGLTNVVKYGWDYGYSNATSVVSSQNIQLDATPVFFTKSGGSTACALSPEVSNILCNDNGTPNNPADDTFTFQLTVTGSGTSSTWNLTNNIVFTGGLYNIPTTFGPFSIAGGIKYFTVRDNVTPACAYETFVTPPATCSNGGTGGGSCTTNLLTNNGFENGTTGWDVAGSVETPNDALAGTKGARICGTTASRLYQTKGATAGKTYTFRIQTKRTGDAVNGSTISLKFMSNQFAPLQTDFIGIPLNANWNELLVTKTAPVNTAFIEISVNKEPGNVCVHADEACVSEGGGTTNPCNINASVSQIACNNNGTPSVTTDDFFSFNLSVSGANTSSGWTATVGNQTVTGTYGVAKSVTNLPISGGNVAITVKDNGTATCTTTATATAPAPCSTGGTGGGTPNCASKGEFPWHEYITEVKLGTSFTKTSDKSQYSDFQNPAISVQKNVATPISVKVSWSWATADEYVKVWLDMNGDNILDDVSEVIFQQKITNPGNGSAPKTVSGNIVIPGSAVAGSAKMRVSVKRDGFATPCETIPFGEVEDYRVTIPTSFSNNPTDNRGEEIAAAVSNDFEIYPNPSDGLATLRVTDFIGKQVTIAIFNQNGQKIKELRFDQLDIPWVEIDLGEVPTGQFFIQLNAAGMRSVSKKMMVSKKF